MKRISWQRLSLLGLVLTAASAVTAAILPNKSDDSGIKYAAGSITVSSDGLPTCTVASNGGVACNMTTGSATTTNQDIDSTVGLGHIQTFNNTTT